MSAEESTVEGPPYALVPLRNFEHNLGPNGSFQKEKTEKVSGIPDQCDPSKSTFTLSCSLEVPRFVQTLTTISPVDIERRRVFQPSPRYTHRNEAVGPRRLSGLPNDRHQSGGWWEG